MSSYYQLLFQPDHVNALVLSHQSSQVEDDRIQSLSWIPEDEIMPK